MRTIARSSSNKEVGERPGQLGLADAGRAEEEERADRPVGVGQAGPAAPDGVGDGRVTASSWPITRSCSTSSRRSSLCISPSMSRLTGTPVHLLTTSAMSSSSTSSFNIF